MKLGAYDFIQKPVDPTRLKMILTNASRQRETEQELEFTRRKLREKGVLGSLVGSSKKMQDIFALIERVAPSNVSVLITGESGTGKELVARTLHELSPRKAKPFVAVNCAAIPETLIEARSSATKKAPSPAPSSAAPAASSWPRKAPSCSTRSARCPSAPRPSCCASSRRSASAASAPRSRSPSTSASSPPPTRIPREAVDDGHLRGDLFYRLNVFNIHMPPLREHKEDIPAILESILADMNEKHERTVTGVDKEMLARLMSHDWPGNVRELRNTIERAVILCGEGQLESRHLPPGFGERVMRPGADDGAYANSVQVEVGATVDEAERLLILKTLESTRNNKTRAAEILGISLKTLHNKLKEYGSASFASAESVEERV